MAIKQFGVDIDLDLNQLQNSRAENGTGFTTGGALIGSAVEYKITENKNKK